MGRTKSAKLNKRKLPPYKEMVTIAIQELGEKLGSDKKDIVKYVKANWDVDSDGTEKMIESELKKGVKDGNLVQNTKGKSRIRLFRLNQPKETSKKKSEDTLVKESKKEKTKKTELVEDVSETSKPDTMTRAKLPIKVKEAKEKKKAAAIAKRASTAKKTKSGRRKGKKRKASDANSAGGSKQAKPRRIDERGIDARIYAYFEEIWKNM